MKTYKKFLEKFHKPVTETYLPKKGSGTYTKSTKKQRGIERHLPHVTCLTFLYKRATNSSHCRQRPTRSHHTKSALYHVHINPTLIYPLLLTEGNQGRKYLAIFTAVSQDLPANLYRDNCKGVHVVPLSVKVGLFRCGNV